MGLAGRPASLSHNFSISRNFRIDTNSGAPYNTIIETEARDTQMTLKTRAAAALDATHSKTTIVVNGDIFTTAMIDKIRATLAAWLDGQKMRNTLAWRYVECLEMIARH